MACGMASSCLRFPKLPAPESSKLGLVSFAPQLRPFKLVDAEAESGRSFISLGELGARSRNRVRRAEARARSGGLTPPYRSSEANPSPSIKTGNRMGNIGVFEPGALVLCERNR